MKIKLQHLKEGICKWYAAEIAPFNWKLYFTLPLVKIGLDGLERNHNGIIGILLDQNGEIDIDELHKEYANLIVQKGGTVDIGPFKKFNTQDLEKLISYIKQGVPQQPNA